MLQTNLVPASSAGVSVQLGELRPALVPPAQHLVGDVRDVIPLTLHRLMNAEVLLDCEVAVDLDSLIAERTHVHFAVLFFVGLASV